MKNLMIKFTVPLTALFLLFWAMSAATSANAGPRKPKPPYSVAEPATLALLGAGVLSLGLFAAKKRNRR